MKKLISLFVILLIVSCSTDDFESKSIRNVKSSLIDPESFELISYRLDTITSHDMLRDFSDPNNDLLLKSSPDTLVGYKNVVEYWAKYESGKRFKGVDHVYYKHDGSYYKTITK